MIVVLLLLYPALRPNDLVGTDLVQAVPLVASAALGHVFFGDLHLDLAATILIGSIPGVLIGSRLSSRAPAGVVRAGLVAILLASATKLFGAPNVAVLGAVCVAVIGAVVTLLVSRSRRPAPQRQPEPEPVPAG